MQFIKINPLDNVVVAVDKISSGTEITVDQFKIILKSDIPAGHKISIFDIKENESIIKYGNRIGYAKCNIEKGSHVHVHNLKTALDGVESYTYEPIESKELKVLETMKFQGFMRENGKAGIRNEIWIIPTVGCVNSVANKLAEIGNKLICDNICGEVVAFPHPYGCSQLGSDEENTRKILADLVNHPNAGGVLVLGLGCENSGVESLKKYVGDYNPERVKFLVCQESDDEIADGTELLKDLIEFASKEKRTEIDINKLIVGLKCGGSDGFSGITANPVVGGFSDLLVAMGGTTILTEVPEMFGAEQILMNRAKNNEIFDKTVALINDFKEYYQKSGMPIYENPSPGNKDGGISTLEDKSLGCTQKSGSAAVTGVLAYGDFIKTTDNASGLYLLSAPGNDLVAATALAAAGAQIVLFTTGRGTPFASPVPTLKISSNTALSEKKSNWIDFNTGEAVKNKNISIESLSEDLLKLVTEVASGKKVRSEEAGYHDMAIFKTGVTL